MYKDLNEAKSKFAAKNILKAQSYDDKQKFVSKFNVFEEEFILNKIKDRIEYNIYK